MTCIPSQLFHVREKDSPKKGGKPSLPGEDNYPDRVSLKLTMAPASGSYAPPPSKNKCGTNMYQIR